MYKPFQSTIITHFNPKPYYLSILYLIFFSIIGTMLHNSLIGTLYIMIYIISYYVPCCFSNSTLR